MHLHTRSITISQCISKFTRSWPPGVSPNTLDYHLQVHLQTRTITDSKFARSSPQTTSPNSLDDRPQVYLSIRSMTASKCISKVARSRPWNVSLSSLDYGLQVYLQIRLMPPASASPNSHIYGLQVRTIIASKCICKLAQSRPRSESLSSLDRHSQAHLELLPSSACCPSRYTLYRWVAI